MKEIKCPNCGKVFQVDESGYAQIAQQIRDQEFSRELARREQELEQKREDDLKLVRMEQEKVSAEALAKKDAELSAQAAQIEQLKTQLSAGENEKKLAVSEVTRQKDAELSAQAAQNRTAKGAAFHRRGGEKTGGFRSSTAKGKGNHRKSYRDHGAPGKAFRTGGRESAEGKKR